MMKLSNTRKRRLKAESLETRQMLHGGAFAPNGQAPSTEDRVAQIFSRLDVNQDGLLGEGDEISDRIGARLANAETDGVAGISEAELTAHIEAKIAEREQAERPTRPQDGPGGRQRPSHHRPGRHHPGRGQRPSVADVPSLVDRVFAARDENGDGALDADELGRRWNRISEAAGDDGLLTSDELASFLTNRIADRNQEGDPAAAENDGEDQPQEAVAEDASQTRFRSMNQHRRMLRRR